MGVIREARQKVLKIIKNRKYHYEYDEHYYFTEVVVVDGKTNIKMTGDVWKATHFNNIMTDAEIDAWYNFIKTNLGKNYTVSFETITLNYT